MVSFLGKGGLTSEECLSLHQPIIKLTTLRVSYRIVSVDLRRCRPDPSIQRKDELESLKSLSLEGFV
jgi:hypothetical protein